MDSLQQKTHLVVLEAALPLGRGLREQIYMTLQRLEQVPWGSTVDSGYLAMAMDQYLLIPFLVGWTSINPNYFDVHQGYKVLTHCHLMIFRGPSKKPFSPSECCGSRDAERHERLPLRSAHRTPLASACGDGCEQPVAVSGATGRASQFGMARKEGRDWNESPGGAFSPRDVRFCVFHGNMVKLDILAQSSKVGNLSGQLWVLGLEPLWLFLKLDLFQGAK